MNKNNLQLLATANKSQLIVIDVQSRLSQTVSDQKSLLKNCVRLIRSAKLLSIPVTVTEQYPKGIGSTDTELVESLGCDYQPITKTSFSCCGADEFNSTIEAHSGRKQLILCGIEAHICVLQTAMQLLQAAPQAGYQVFIIADAVDSRTTQNKELALNRLQLAGVIASSTESIIFEWLQNANNDNFKQISALIR